MNAGRSVWTRGKLALSIQLVPECSLMTSDVTQHSIYDPRVANNGQRL